jgi:hypothetical protein
MRAKEKTETSKYLLKIKLATLQSGTPVFRRRYPSRRGEGGGEWLGGPLCPPAFPQKKVAPSVVIGMKAIANS